MGRTSTVAVRLPTTGAEKKMGAAEPSERVGKASLRMSARTEAKSHLVMPTRVASATPCQV